MTPPTSTLHRTVRLGRFWPACVLAALAALGACSTSAPPPAGAASAPRPPPLTAATAPRSAPAAPQPVAVVPGPSAVASGGPTRAAAPTRLDPRPVSLPTLSYADVLAVIGDARGDDKIVRTRLLGRQVRLTLKASGPQALVVDAADAVYFTCRERERGFKAGAVLATVVGYESTPLEGDASLTLGRCAAPAPARAPTSPRQPSRR